MRFGISPFASRRSVVVEVAARAVQGGLDTLWLGDGLLLNPDFPPWAGGMETFCELSWLAGRFPTARVGISAAVLPVRDVDWVIKQAATLDQLTEGGFVLAVAAGFWEREAAARGVDFARRGAVFDERLAAITSAFGPEPDPERRLAPVPFTEGGPPVWLAGGEATMAKALRLGLPFQSSRLTPSELEPLAKRWFDAGGGVLAHRVRVEVGRAAVAGHEVEWHAVVGSAPQVTEQLAAFREMGVGDLSIIPGQDDDSALATVEALATEVLPQLGVS
jgi:alkanesulfonate monooxygenase SsuD/methylene tetrahydromethanopterin reductase-like flavin-dependent oxidoreductase (luciferase family)